MFHFEDTTTTVENEEKDENLVILDGTTKQEIKDHLEHEKEKQKKHDDGASLLDRIRKLM